MTILKEGKAAVYLVVHRLDPIDISVLQDTLTADSDTLLLYVADRSRVHLLADGPDGTAYARTDSIRTFTNPFHRKAFAVFQTEISKYWGDGPYPPYQETPAAPVYWIDISSADGRYMLEVFIRQDQYLDLSLSVLNSVTLAD